MFNHVNNWTTPTVILCQISHSILYLKVNAGISQTHSWIKTLMILCIRSTYALPERKIKTYGHRSCYDFIVKCISCYFVFNICYIVLKWINIKSKKLNTYNYHVYLFVYTHICLLKKSAKYFAIWWIRETFWSFYINSWSQVSAFLQLLTHFENKKDLYSRFSEFVQMFKSTCCYHKT